MTLKKGGGDKFDSCLLPLLSWGVLLLRGLGGGGEFTETPHCGNHQGNEGHTRGKNVDSNKDKSGDDEELEHLFQPFLWFVCLIIVYHSPPPPATFLTPEK